MKYIALTVLLTLFTYTPVQAKDWYAGARLGSTNNEINDVVSERSTTWGVFGGYQVLPKVAIHVGYTDLGSMAGVDFTTMELAALGSIPLVDLTSFYIKMGTATTTGKVMGSTIDRSFFTFGMGVQYDMQEQLALRFGFDIYGFGKDNSLLSKGGSAMFSLGAMYRF